MTMELIFVCEDIKDPSQPVDYRAVASLFPEGLLDLTVL